MMSWSEGNSVGVLVGASVLVGVDVGVGVEVGVGLGVAGPSLHHNGEVD